ncbi:MAG TPA: hypothetical protein VM912_22625, partial [Terriglobales bacterium]|nr:hypothetical protein [Terriglobales bacterium]
MQRLKCLFVTAFVAVCMLALPTRLLAEDNDCDDNAMKANITALNNSGLSGTARLCLSEDGAAARLRVDGTKAGHAYTAWFFYCPTGSSPCYSGSIFTVGR